MNKLDQLRGMSKVVADTGDIEQIKKYQPEEATTNPSLLLKAVHMPEYAYIVDKAFRKARHLPASEAVTEITLNLATGFGIEILNHIPGRVSTEVDARLSFDTESTIEQAKSIINKYEAQGIDRSRVLIKIAATWEGVKAAELLQKQGIHCNMTLVFHLAQAIACAEAETTLVSPFVGRITDWYMKQKGLYDFPPVDKDPGVLSLKKIYNYYKTFGYSTVCMGASFRRLEQVEALAGCDALTISPELLSELEQSQDTLTRQLGIADQAMVTEKINMSEPVFRWLINDDAMATEKLAEGIRKFAQAIHSLEEVIQKRLARE
jgi:transaldolase